jgi:glycosyltransferase involved in cell wall biosynthesis
LPSLNESFGIVVIEAMLCGIVPVRTPTGGALDQIEDGHTGFIVPLDDDKSLANRLEQLFQDSDLRLRMSRGALAVARERFTATVMIRHTLEVYEETLALARAHRKAKMSPAVVYHEL